MPSIGSVGDAYDNAAAETVMGLFKNEAVARGSPFRSGALKTESDVVEIVFDWVHWYNCETFSSWSGTGWQDRYRPLHLVDVTLGTTDPQGVISLTCPSMTVDWPVPVRPTSVA